MKTIKCSQIGGGTCTFEVTAATAEETKMKMGEHAKVAHADMMANSTPESMVEWNAMFDKLWMETPENPDAAAPESTPAATPESM